MGTSPGLIFPFTMPEKGHSGDGLPSIAFITLAPIHSYPGCEGLLCCEDFTKEGRVYADGTYQYDFDLEVFLRSPYFAVP